jgi:DNA modification methylase
MLGPYQENTIVCGDCVDVICKMPNNSVDLVVTSPPYYNAKDYSAYPTIGDYMAAMCKVFRILFDRLARSRMCVVNIAPVIVSRKSRNTQSYRIPLPFYFVPMMELLGYEFLEDIVWEKPDGAALNRNGGFFQHRKPVAYKPNIVTEYVLVFKKPAPFLIDDVLREDSLVLGEYERTNVWRINPDTNNAHPAPFPEKLASNLIMYYSYGGDLVFDPFMGSGTTAVAADRLGRRWFGCDINSSYVKLALERIEKDRLERSQLEMFKEEGCHINTMNTEI